MIDPGLQRIVDAMAESGFALPDPLSAPALRALLDTPLPGLEIAIADVRDLAVSSAAGPVPVRLYHPLPGAILPVAVFMHGGGWVIGSLDTHDRLARVLARDAQCAVLSVGYRLAPEHPYPAALDDCLAVIDGLPKLAAASGIDANRYAVIGDSAGGNLAAAMALQLRDAPISPLAQIMFYPATNPDFESDSYQRHADCPTLPSTLMRYFWNGYLAETAIDEYAAPLLAANLSGLAPATIMLAGCDPLYDEGRAYAERLIEAGVPTDVHDFSDAIHGFASFLGMVPIADEVVSIAVASMKRAFETSPE